MQILNYRDETVYLNQNEMAVFKAICMGDEYNGSPTIHQLDIFVGGLTKKQIGGYLTQLIKKDVIQESEMPNGGSAWSTYMTFEQIEES